MNEGLINTGKDAMQNRLLVEGSDDVQVCYHLLKCNNIEVPQQIKIEDKRGINNLLKTLDVELMGSQARRIGVIVDADENLADRWQSIVDILAKSGYQIVPPKPELNGTIIREENKPTVGIWLMPDNELPGMLEHFCSFLIPSGDLLWEFADEVVKQVVETDCRFPLNHRMKANVHTWLAWQKEPGKPMGQAITKHFFDYTSPYAQLFVSWIRQLFDISASSNP